MGGGLEGNLSPEKATEGLRLLLDLHVLKGVVPVLGRSGVETFCEQAILVLDRCSKAYHDSGNEGSARVYGAYSTLAGQVLAAEMARERIPNTPLDAEPRMWHDPETGQSYAVVGEWLGGEGYAIELREPGENIMRR